MSADPLLAVEDLRTVFYTEREEIHAVDGVSFSIDEGETVGLVGESGSGKSVTARSILGLVDEPGVIESGSIYFRGEDLTEGRWEAHRGDIAIVFQDPGGSLNPVYTVGNQIREALRIHQGLRGSEARDRAVALLEDVGIPDARRRVGEYPHQLSGGMQQRAVIAMALACDPDLLVCDEPTTALDVTIQAQILDLLDDLQREEDLAILFITHDMGVIEDATDRVNVIYAGEVVERAPTEALFADPAHPYTRALLRSIPGRTPPDEQLPTIEGEVPTPTGRATDCRFAPRCPAAFGACERVHPEHQSVGAPGTDRTAACLLHDDEYDRTLEEAVADPDGLQESFRGRETQADGGDATAAGTADPDGATDADPFLSARDLRTYYDERTLLSRDPPVKAVDGVSFDVYEGETLGLVGESGCGKTTLGRTLVGLESATSGTIEAGGREVTDLGRGERRDWQRRVGMVFQDPEESLNDRQTVGESIREPLDAHGWPFLPVAVESPDGAVDPAEATVSGDAVTVADGDANGGREADITVRVRETDHEVAVRDELPLERGDVSVTVDRDAATVSVSVAKSAEEMRRERVFDLLERVGLQEQHYYRYPHQFSGGQRQRVGIARALALEPEFLVLDEPVSALDVSVQARIINLLEEIQDELGLTYLFIAHDLAVVRHIADRVAVMYLGNIVELGPAEAVYTDPAHPYTLSLLSAIPGSGSPWSGDRMRLRGAPPSPRDPPEGCPFATRCPAKIRPDDPDLDEETWRALDELRVVFRTRSRAEFSAVETLRGLAGLAVDEAVDLAVHGDDAEAAARLREAFGSRCDAEHPRPYDRGEGRQSRCLRHEAEYRDAPETVDAREEGSGL
ncbi:peptide ABC transporter ATP-binding protein [Halobacteriales archaeon QH_3_68_24]|nr:MAG: peptide ABC transporter ATP-binding protein [Halobacteriales archaeon QH_3_68_24]